MDYLCEINFALGAVRIGGISTFVGRGRTASLAKGPFEVLRLEHEIENVRSVERGNARGRDGRG